LDRHTAAFACALALPKAGINIDINNAIIAITTKSSISVKPRGLHMHAPLAYFAPTVLKSREMFAVFLKENAGLSSAEKKAKKAGSLSRPLSALLINIQSVPARRPSTAASPEG
jgi:hypothetical protein